jgi:hypothetical protein
MGTHGHQWGRGTDSKQQGNGGNKNNEKTKFAPYVSCTEPGCFRFRLVANATLPEHIYCPDTKCNGLLNCAYLPEKLQGFHEHMCARAPIVLTGKGVTGLRPNAGPATTEASMEVDSAAPTTEEIAKSTKEATDRIKIIEDTLANLTSLGYHPHEDLYSELAELQAHLALHSAKPGKVGDNETNWELNKALEECKEAKHRVFLAVASKKAIDDKIATLHSQLERNKEFAIVAAKEIEKEEQLLATSGERVSQLSNLAATVIIEDLEEDAGAEEGLEQMLAQQSQNLRVVYEKQLEDLSTQIQRQLAEKLAQLGDLLKDEKKQELLTFQPPQATEESKQLFIDAMGRNAAQAEAFSQKAKAGVKKDSVIKKGKPDKPTGKKALTGEAASAQGVADSLGGKIKAAVPAT